MNFTVSFILNFGLSFAGYLALGIALCHGSWRTVLRTPYELAAAFVLAGHVFSSQNFTVKIVLSTAAFVLVGFYIGRRRRTALKPVAVREGHNILSLLIGAALFALTVQLHALLFGVAVFRITG